MILLSCYKDGSKRELSEADILKFIKEKDKVAIASFIYDRHYYRYIKPFECPSREYIREFKNGFSIMANCCLLIESIESYRKGLKNAKGRSRNLFKSFFAREKWINVEDPSSFYSNVRCGILHQGETTGGWSITRKGTDLLKDNKLDANLFRDALKGSLNNYKESLLLANIDDELWVNAIKKIYYVIENCKAK